MIGTGKAFQARNLFIQMRMFSLPGTLRAPREKGSELSLLDAENGTYVSGRLLGRIEETLVRRLLRVSPLVFVGLGWIDYVAIQRPD
jgi:hypothetical protein